MAISREAQALALYRDLVRDRVEAGLIDPPTLSDDERRDAHQLAKLSLQLIDVFLEHIPPQPPKGGKHDG